MASEITLVCWFEYDPDVEEVIAEVQAALNCNVVDWHVEEV